MIKVFGQGLEDALKPQNDDEDFFKVVQCFVWSNTFFLMYDQNS